ncbi:OLC1v1021204C1 [Oldenlandia corymbosa var. corymbosa]|uniref:OLC1v1021204C1 n=1 Tax=Oldenlandia corymbosa var. corymbosa TaxID=529605 RepID=A0AAV1BV53_OLDCO|nr:OLC1v1021204C1 [Oldenlandia corymbosa var. corymbosa]
MDSDPSRGPPDKQDTIMDTVEGGGESQIPLSFKERLLGIRKRRASTKVTLEPGDVIMERSPMGGKLKFSEKLKELFREDWEHMVVVSLVRRNSDIQGTEQCNAEEEEKALRGGSLVCWAVLLIGSEMDARSICKEELRVQPTVEKPEMGPAKQRSGMKDGTEENSIESGGQSNEFKGDSQVGLGPWMVAQKRRGRFIRQPKPAPERPSPLPKQRDQGGSRFNVLATKPDVCSAKDPTVRNQETSKGFSFASPKQVEAQTKPNKKIPRAHKGADKKSETENRINIGLKQKGKAARTNNKNQSIEKERNNQGQFSYPILGGILSTPSRWKVPPNQVHALGSKEPPDLQRGDKVEAPPRDSMVLWNEGDVSVRFLGSSRQWVYFHWETGNDKGLCTAVYASPAAQVRRILWQDLVALRNQCSEPWVRLIWVVGNGRTVRFWEDVWVEGAGRLADHAERNIPTEWRMAPVVEFTLPNRSWDVAKMNSILPCDLVGRICRIPPPMEALGKDRPSWLFNKAGKFSVKSAYELALDDSILQANRDWRKIWSWEGPQRMRSFLWLAWHDRLPTNVLCKRRGVIPTETCSGCSREAESTLHALRDCPVARELWTQLVPRDRRHTFFQQELKQWLKSNLDANDLKWKTNFVSTCWLIWRWRNERVFNGRL